MAIFGGWRVYNFVEGASKSECKEGFAHPKQPSTAQINFFSVFDKLYTSSVRMKRECPEIALSFSAPILLIFATGLEPYWGKVAQQLQLPKSAFRSIFDALWKKLW